MARSPRYHFPGAIYHVTARGNAQQTIFFQPGDWEKFLGIILSVKKDRPFNLYAYCLMSNHVHLLIEPLCSSISVIVGLILNKYAKYLNARLDRVGHVFQGRFHSRLCVRDSYFKELVRYIHLNPVKASMVVEPSAWPYSGHLEYMSRRDSALIDKSLLLSMFHPDPGQAREAYLRFVLRQVGQPQEIVLPTPPVSDVPSAPAERKLESISGPGLRAILEKAAAEAAIFPDLLLNPTKVRAVVRARRDFMARAYQAGHSMTAIAAHLQMSLTAVSNALGKCGDVEKGDGWHRVTKEGLKLSR